MNVPRQWSIIIELSGETLQFYQSIAADPAHRAVMPPEFFWRDSESPHGWGPFVNLYAAGKHYSNFKVEERARKAKPVSDLEKDNLIKIDFVNKRRVP